MISIDSARREQKRRAIRYHEREQIREARCLTRVDEEKKMKRSPHARWESPFWVAWMIP